MEDMFVFDNNLILNLPPISGEGLYADAVLAAVLARTKVPL